MTDQATHEFEAAAVSEAAIAEGATVKRPTASAVQQRRDVKGHLITSMIMGLDDVPHGDKGRQYAELTIDRLKCTWKVNEDGQALKDAEVYLLQETIPGTNANKAFKAKKAN